MSQDLGPAGEWDRLAPLVIVVVGMPREDVEVGAAQAHGGDAHLHVAWPRLLARHVAQLDPADVDENGGPPGPAAPTPPPTSTDNTAALGVGGTVGGPDAGTHAASVL